MFSFIRVAWLGLLSTAIESPTKTPYLSKCINTTCSVSRMLLVCFVFRCARLWCLAGMVHYPSLTAAAEPCTFQADSDQGAFALGISPRATTLPCHSLPIQEAAESSFILGCCHRLSPSGQQGTHTPSKRVCPSEPTSWCSGNIVFLPYSQLFHQGQPLVWGSLESTIIAVVMELATRTPGPALSLTRHMNLNKPLHPLAVTSSMNKG